MIHIIFFNILILMSLSSVQSLLQFNSSQSVEHISPHVNKNKASELYGKLPLSFVANYGQTDKQVKYLSQGNGYNLFLTQNEAVLSVKSSDTKKVHKQAVLRMQLIGANSASEVDGLDKLPGKVNYLNSKDKSAWHTDIPTYSKVKYQNIYDGIDLVYYGNQRRLEYDFIVSPGADPKKITFAYSGAEKMKVDFGGDLVLDMGGEEMRMLKPFIYQEIGGVKKEVAGKYLLSDNRVSFQVDKYDRSQPLVIDPILVYSTYLGGINQDIGYDIAVDQYRNAYVVGETISPNFPTANAYDTSLNSTQDVFVAKLSSDGTSLVYSTYLGSGLGYGIAVDEFGNAYVTGVTYNGASYPTLNAFQNVYEGNGDAFVTKLSSSGNTLIYSTYLGGSDEDLGKSIAVDESGNAYVTGSTFSSNFPTLNPFQNTYGGNEDVFVTKLSSTGSSLLYSTYLGGESSDRNAHVALDTSGNAYVAGLTGSLNFPIHNPIQSNGDEYGNAFVTKFLSGGDSVEFSTYIGGSGSDYANDIAIDINRNIYITGWTNSSNFPTYNALRNTINGSEAGFVTKLSSTGSELSYSTYIGSGGSGGVGIAVNGTGEAYISGRLVPNANYLYKLSDSGNSLIYSMFIASDRADVKSLAIDNSGNIYLTGLTLSGFPTKNAYDYTFNDSYDAFVMKITENAPPIVGTVTISPNPVPINTSVSATATFTDPDTTDIHTATIDWGDGSSLQACSVTESNGSVNCTRASGYETVNVYPVTITVSDGIDDVTFPVTYASVYAPTPENAPPIVGTVTISPNPVPINTSVSATATFTDPDTTDIHTATIDWGDGSSLQACSVTESNGSVNCTRASGYETVNVYPVTITVSDGIDDVTFPVTYASVYAPTPQGLFSAGQRFVAPTGGNVTFGLSYKYQGTVPTGHRQFSIDYNQENIHFNAASVNALVINNGMATLTGTGTYNGTNGYSFLVTGDENANTIRIQIKDQSGNVIYDTQPGEADTATPTTPVAGNVIVN